VTKRPAIPQQLYKTALRGLSAIAELLVLLLVTAASNLIVHKILLNSVLLFPIASGGVRPTPRTNTA